MSGPMGTTCPDCGTTNHVGNAFCEVCGLDFETGEKASPPPPPALFDPTAAGRGGAAATAPAEAAEGATWLAVIEVDEVFFASNQAAEHAGEIALPTEQVSREVPMVGDDLLIGRRSSSRGITPAIDLSVPPQDTGVSHRHATLSRRGSGWSVTDLGSTNGSWITGQPDPLEPFVEEPLRDGEALLLGAWTRISLRRVEATEAEPGATTDDGREEAAP